jgi:eukaryotic-like serine/threonine-protein kinase
VVNEFERLSAVLAGRYRIERELGRGGMATVYLAQDLKHHRQVAIKVLKRELAVALGPERFLREIEIAARLTHPNILPLHDSGEADGLFYYVMPFVEGESLRDRLERQKQLPLHETVEITRAVADALSHAHGLGIVHRDIKPENILFEAGHAVVTDFGIARAITQAAGEHLTATGIAVGTPAYMSPEQAAGARDLDARSDIYALGCVLYEMLSGQPPFTGRSAQAVLARHSVDPVLPLRTVRDTVPGALETVVLRALAKVPADRFATAREFAEALEQSLRTPQVSGRFPSVRRRRAFPLAVGTSVVVALGVWWAVTRPPVVDAQALVILPFRVHGPPELQYLSEGMVDLFHIALDGAGGLQVLHPRRALRSLIRLRDPTDATQAAAVVRSLGAGRLVSGSVVASGADLQVRADLYDAVRQRSIAVAHTRGGVSQLDSLVDAVVSTLLARQLLVTPGTSRPSMQEYATTSPRALQALLVAEQLERRGEWQAAAESLQSCLALDPRFGRAYYVLRRIAVNRNVTAAVPDGSTGILRRARAHIAGFPERLRLLLLIQDAWEQGQRVLALRTADEVASRFPNDGDAAYHQADMYFHFGLQFDEPSERVTQMLRRAISLDDGIPETHDHYIVLLGAAGDTIALLEALRHVRAIAPGDPETAAAELAIEAAFRKQDPWLLARSVPAGERAVVVGRAQQKVLRFMSSDLGPGVALADSLAAFLTGPEHPRGTRVTALLRRHGYALAQGRYQVAWTFVTEAAALDPGNVSILARILLHDVVTGSRGAEARQAARRLATFDSLPLAPAVALAWHALLRLPPESAESKFAALENRSWPDSAIGRALAAGLRGLLSLRLGDTRRARERLTIASENQGRRPGLNAILYPSAAFAIGLAVLDRAAGDASAARRRLADVYPEHEVLPFLAEAEEMRAQLSEQLGDPTSVRSAYGNVVSLWEHADPELRPRVARAQAALARLDHEVQHARAPL